MSIQHTSVQPIAPELQSNHSAPTSFDYYSTVTIGDTNLLGNMYFTNHFKIQGITRELWMNECVNNADQHLANGLVLVTKTAHCDYIKDFYLNDRILCQMAIGKIRKASFELKFEFINANTKAVHARAYQEIVFADSNHNICKMPEEFLNAAKRYQEQKVND